MCMLAIRKKGAELLLKPQMANAARIGDVKMLAQMVFQSIMKGIRNFENPIALFNKKIEIYGIEYDDTVNFIKNTYRTYKNEQDSFDEVVNILDVNDKSKNLKEKCLNIKAIYDSKKNNIILQLQNKTFDREGENILTRNTNGAHINHSRPERELVISNQINLI